MTEDKMLIITAPGRCGTSLVARYCNLLGHDPGGEWDDPSNSGMECKNVQRATFAIDHHEDKEALMAKIRSSSRAVAKNCRFFRETKIVDSWHDAAPGLRFLALWRDPRDQFDSWVQKPRETPDMQAFTWPRRPFVEWVNETRHEFIANCNAREIPIRWLHYPYFVDEQPLLAEYLHWGGLEFNDCRARKIWRNLVDPSLVHHHAAIPRRDRELCTQTPWN